MVIAKRNFAFDCSVFMEVSDLAIIYSLLIQWGAKFYFTG